MIITISTIYFLVLFVIAFFSRKNENLEEFIVAGKKFGSLITAAASRATGESAWLILGFTGFGYAFGIKGLWIALGETVCVYLSWAFIAPKFKQLIDGLGANTYTEFLEKATNDNTGLVRLVSSITICLLVISYVSAQFLGIGKAFEIFFNMPLSYGIWLGAILTVGYTVIGGYRAISWGDFFQAIIMLFGLIALLVMLVLKIPSVNYHQIILLPEGFWSLLGNEGFTWKGFAMVVSFLAIGTGLFGIPHMFVPFIAARDVKVIKRGALVAVLFTFVTEVSALSLGILARFFVTNLADSEQIMPVLSQLLLSPLWSGILVAVIFASIMSTADSLLMSASTSLIYDLYRNYFQSTRDRNQHLILLSRICLVVISLLGAFLAQNEYSFIFWLVVFVWSALTAAFVPLCISLVYGKAISNYQAVISIIVGFLSAALWRMFLFEKTGIGEIIAGLFFSSISLPISKKIGQLFDRLIIHNRLKKKYAKAV